MTVTKLLFAEHAVLDEHQRDGDEEHQHAERGSLIDLGRSEADHFPDAHRDEVKMAGLSQDRRDGEELDQQDEDEKARRKKGGRDERKRDLQQAAQARGAAHRGRFLMHRVHVAQRGGNEEMHIGRVVDREDEADAAEAVDVDGGANPEGAQRDIDDAAPRRGEDVPGEGSDERWHEHRQDGDPFEQPPSGHVGSGREPGEARADQHGARRADHGGGERHAQEIEEAACGEDFAVVAERQPRPINAQRARRRRQERPEDERDNGEDDEEQQARDKQRHEETPRRQRLGEDLPRAGAVARERGGRRHGEPRRALSEGMIRARSRGMVKVISAPSRAGAPLPSATTSKGAPAQSSV